MKPNIVFLFPDQWRGDWCGDTSIGKKLRLRALKKLAESGVTFTRAFSPSPLCAPARACVACGKAYPAYGVCDNAHDLPSSAHTVYQALRDNGYHVMGCGKFDLHKASFSWGRDGKNMMESWGFSDGIDNEGKLDGVHAFAKHQTGPYLDFLEKRGKAEIHVSDFEKRGKFGTFPTPLTDDEYCDNWLTHNALQLLSRAPDNKPWFLQVNFTGPHSPYDVTQKMYEDNEERDFPPPFGSYHQAIDHRSVRRNYASMVENIDRNISLILQHPKIKDHLKETTIIFASDHGDMLGDHGYFQKELPYNGSAHVPLILSGYGIEKRGDIAFPVTTLDVPATFLSLAGIDHTKCDESLSLLPLIRTSIPERTIIHSRLYIENNPMREWEMHINEKYKFIKWAQGKEALYALTDYEEKYDLSTQAPEDALSLMKQ